MIIPNAPLFVEIDPAWTTRITAKLSDPSCFILIKSPFWKPVPRFIKETPVTTPPVAVILKVAAAPEDLPGTGTVSIPVPVV